MPRKKPTGTAKQKARKSPAKPKNNRATPLKAQRRRLTPESSPESYPITSRKRTASVPSPSHIPDYDRNVTSQAARFKKRFSLTRASLYDESINERSIAEGFGMLDPNSFSKHTWGDPIDQAIVASTKRKTGGISKRSSKRPSKDISRAYADMMEDMRPDQGTIIANTPDISGLLRLSLEIRDMIYGYLLTYPKPIMVKYDWQTTEQNPYTRHAIIITCKQLHAEGSSFLYRMNTIQAVFRKPTNSFSLYEEPSKINSRFLPYIRNVIVDCSRDCWSIDWFEKASESIETLSKANAVINSITLVAVPQRVGMSSTALGMESNPVTFADFVWYPGSFMTSLRKLRPREFNIIIKKGAIKRLLVTVDLRYLEASGRQKPELMNTETLKLLVEKERKVELELIGLKDRFEEIFEDDEWAIQQGKCTLISGGRSTQGGDRSSATLQH